MLTRIISAAVGAVVLVSVLLCPYMEVIRAAIAIVMVISIFEAYRAFNCNKKYALCTLGCIAAIMFVYKPFAGENIFALTTAVYLLILSFIMFKTKVRVADVSVMVFLTLYICYPLSKIADIREMEYGRYYIWLVFVGAFLTDTGAYFIGSFFGKHKLCPTISPKKTIEGSIGGIIFCILTFCLTCFIFGKISGRTINYSAAVVLGFLCSVFSQAGDLFASYIKRERGIKDYGDIMPGHGGILDRIDSVIFTAPLVYAFLLFYEIIL